MAKMIENMFKNWKQNWATWLLSKLLFLFTYFTPTSCLGNKSEYNFIMLETRANSIKATVLKGNRFELMG